MLFSFVIKGYYVFVSTLKLLLLKARKTSKVKYGVLPYFKGKINIELSVGGVLDLGNRIKMMTGCRVGVREGALVRIGNNTSINVGTQIISHEKIEIGDNVQIGPYCMIYDHDHVYERIESLDSQEFRTTPINIGNHVWIGANCIILRGTVIGDNCVVAAGTVLKGKYAENSLIYSKRDICTKKINTDAEEK